MLATVATAGVVLLVLLLLVPIGLELQIDEGEPEAPARRQLRLSWPAGLLAFDLLASPRAAGGGLTPPRARVTAAAAPRRSPGRAPARMLRLLRSRGFLPGVLKLLRRLLLALHPRQVKVSLVLGLEDPADTGQLWAALGPLSSVLWSASDGALVVAPDFCRPRATLAAEGRLTMIPAQVIGILLAFALSPTVLRAARSASRT